MGPPIVPLHLGFNLTKKSNLFPIPSGIPTGNYPSPTTSYHVIFLNRRHDTGCNRPYNMYQNNELNYGRSCFHKNEQANYETNYYHGRSQRNHRFTPTNMVSKHWSHNQCGGNTNRNLTVVTPPTVATK